ncbi:MAG: hypothetical protein DCE88_04130 [Betaproteobacteria bacterium]|nr:MAG: hypothetical protein DCE88_04130 [Betaproteobacteria bacterium]
MPRKSESFSRGRSKFQQQPRILVVCDDLKSAKDYLRDLRRRLGALVDVEHFGDTSPTKVLKESIRLGKSYDKIFCVLDADTFAAEKFDPLTSVPLSDRQRLTIVPSCPCFEYWLLLHFSSTRSSFTSSSLLKALCKEPDMIGYTKGGIDRYLDILFDNLAVARSNAMLIRVLNEQDGSTSPMTDLDMLVQHFESLAAPKPIV